MAVIRIFSKVLAILFAVILITAPVSTALAAGDSWKDNTQENKPTDDKSQDKSKDDKSKDDKSHDNKPEKPSEKDDDDDEKSRHKLKDRLKSLHSVSTPPLNLKQQAHEDISSIIPAENKNNKDIIKKLGSAELHIAASIDPGAWYGENRLKPVQKSDDDDSEDGDDDSDDNYDESESEIEIETTVFKDERTAAKNILEIISKNKDGTIDDDLLIDILINLVQADRNIAQTSITDLQRAASLAITNPEDDDDSE
ncbi:MAG: hypothetical protein KAH86_03480, partial [Methanosarcinales archaeon]|nr:hypothetical protein [Methanosarcinales archaeon]